MPSRPTDTSPSQKIDQPLPTASAAAAPSSSSAFIRPPTFSIQKTIQVIMPTASSDMAPPMISWAWKLSV